MSVGMAADRNHPYDLTGSIALVTGAGQGFGREFRRYLATAGALVVATDMNPDAEEATAGAIRALGGDARSFELDVTDPRRVEGP